MKLDGRSWFTAAGIAGTLLLLFSFQNCAPMLPLEGQASVLASARPTATPGPIGTPNPGNGNYNSNPINGICSDDVVSEPMAVRYTGSSFGSLLAFNLANSNKVAFWKVNNGLVAHGVVCWIEGTNPEDSKWTLAAVGDFNGDLNPDVVWRNSLNNQILVWVLNGANRVQAAILKDGATPLTMDGTWKIEGVGSFDGDGRQDLLWRNDAGAIRVWAMNGISAPTSKTMTGGESIANNYKIIGLADFDGNYRSDILFRDGGTNKVWQTTTNATTGVITVTETAIATPIGAGVTVAAMGDFNGDARTDLVLQDSASLAIEVRYMYGMAQYTTPLQVNAPAAGWQMQFAQDMTSDFIADWVWVIPGSSDPLLAFTPMSGAPGSTRTLRAVNANWSPFKFSHY